MTNDRAIHIKNTNLYRDLDPTRHHRENLWDYKGRAIYHITLATEKRQPIFGTLTGNSEEDAYITYSRLGEYVDNTLRALPDYYQQKGIRLKVLAVRVMPDHVHGIIHITEPMPKSIGEIIRSFKSACTSWYKREYFGKNAEEMHNQRNVHNQETGKELRNQETGKELRNQGVGMKLEERLVHFCRIFATRGSIWEYMPAGYHERILHWEGQLDNMINYIKDNPRRLWLKHNNPDLFKIRNDWYWSYVDEKGHAHTWKFRVMGNMFLINFPAKQHIQCSRSIIAEDLEQQYNIWKNKAQQGVVSITSAISEGEKTISKRLRTAGMPLVVMLNDGFPPVGSPHEKYFKPGGVYFDACAEGKLLLIEPYPEVLDDPAVEESVYRKTPVAHRNSMRYKFLALNYIGKALAEKNWQ